MGRLAAAILLAVTLVPASAAAQDVRPATTDYEVVGWSEAEEMLDTAIVDATRELSWLRRPFVRAQLRAQLFVARRVQFEVGKRNVTVQPEGRRPMTTPKDGTRIAHEIPGTDVVAYAQQVAPQHIRQVLEGADSKRETLYTFATHGQLMFAHVVATHPALESPVLCTITYRVVQAGAARASLE